MFLRYEIMYLFSCLTFNNRKIIANKNIRNMVFFVIHSVRFGMHLARVKEKAVNLLIIIYLSSPAFILCRSHRMPMNDNPKDANFGQKIQKKIDAADENGFYFVQIDVLRVN